MIEDKPRRIHRKKPPAPIDWNKVNEAMATIRARRPQGVRKTDKQVDTLELNPEHVQTVTREEMIKRMVELKKRLAERPQNVKI